MITLSGGYGKRTLWGTFKLPERLVRGAAADFPSLDLAIPPTEWYLPPPDGLWYPTVGSPYGPRVTEIEVGNIVSHDDRSNEFNPCQHSTIRGDAIYSGKDGELAPYWRVRATPGSTQFTCCSDGWKHPVPTGQRLTVMTGKPCTATDPNVYSYTGPLVRCNLMGYGEYYNAWTDVPAEIAPPFIRSALSPFGTPHKCGRWYCREIRGNLVTNPIDNVHWHYTTWRRPNRTTFVRDYYMEYHTMASYTPAALYAWTDYGYAQDNSHRVSECVVTHIRSDGVGRFKIRYDLTTTLERFGWAPWAPFSENLTDRVSGLEATLCLMSPGLSAEAAIVTELANKYCSEAQPVAALLYDRDLAKRARTLAVCDVQELDSNWIENLSGISGTMDVILPLIDGYRAVSNGDIRAGRRALASAYLSYKYVVSPAMRDYHNLNEDGSRILTLAWQNRFSNERRRGASHLWDIAVCQTKAHLSFYTTLHLTLKDNPFSSVWAALEKIGLEPTASQAWDLIPLSFVADWFMNIGGTLARIDSYNSLRINRDLRARVESFKVQWPLEADVVKDIFDGFICSSGKPLEYSWYDRRVYSTVGEIDPIASDEGNGLSSSQMVQGGAILTQFLR